ncbi:hypothetical protein ACFYZ6_15460 [Streptomyces rubiginosohelvolus]|uniref:hypothetical protein n=1 Tax=Streptomyces TaxID=1883 RepID=UPI0015CF7C24|nr:hypothetical protein [Streptomyces sp. ms184]
MNTGESAGQRMRAMIAWWDLTDAAETAETLQDFVAAEEKHWAEIPGLLLKVWISDPDTRRWGAVLLWESQEAARDAVLPGSPAVRIGHPVDFRAWFDVVATTGPGVAEHLSASGRRPAPPGTE